MVKDLVAPIEKKPRPSAPRSSNDGDVPAFVLPTDEGVTTKKMKRATEAPVVITLHHFSDDSSLFKFAGMPKPMIQAKYSHDAYPSLFLKDKDCRADWIESVHKTMPDFPKTLEEFEIRYDVKYVMSPELPPQSMMEPYARGVYIRGGATEVQAWIDTMDTLVNWRRTKQIDGEYPPIEICIVNCTGLIFDMNREYESTIRWEEKANSCMDPQSPFSIPSPLWVKVHAVVRVEALSNEFVKLRFEGDTLAYQQNFSSLGIPGRYEDKHGKGLTDADLSDRDVKRAAVYVRIIKDINLAAGGVETFLVRAISEKIYKNTLVVVTWEGDFEKDPLTKRFKEAVNALANVRVLDL